MLPAVLQSPCQGPCGCTDAPRLRRSSLTKMTAQAVDGDQMLSTGTSGISSVFSPLFVKQITLPGPGRGFLQSPRAHSPWESVSKHRDYFFCSLQGAGSLCYVKNSSWKGVPIVVCSCFSATAMCTAEPLTSSMRILLGICS